MKTKMFAFRALVLLSLFSAQVSTLLAQGSLTPPGAPAATMKSLDQIEPRTPISSLPFPITNAGSYYLSGNLTSATGGIIIQANEVTVDLMGFALAGGNGSGISVVGTRTNIIIRNGAIRGWTTNGIEAPSAVNSQLESLHVSNNGGYGIRIGTATINKCEVFKNGAEGLYAGAASVLGDCTAQYNGSHGIIVDFDSTVNNCVARQNIGTGIISIYGITVSGCTASFNTASGISVGDGSTVTSCTAKGNGVDGIVATGTSTIHGCTANANSGDGIELSSSCGAVNNTSQGNIGAGINSAGSRNRIDSNTVMGNGTGIKCNPATANLIIRNSARGNTTNYDILAGNNSGAIILTPGVGFSNTNPWANFEF